jgi:predicted DNA-binding WGR domain protein
VNRYALLKDSINDSIFGVIVDSNGLSKFYGVSAKGLEWSKWANGINVKSENNGLPIGVVVGGYSALRNTNPNYIQALVDTVSLRNPSINKKQGISDSLIKNSSSVVPGVRDAELRAFDIDKRNEAIAFKARAFRTDSKVSSLLTQVRAERLGFVSAEGVFSSRNPIHTPEVKQAEIIDLYGRSLQRAIGLSLIRKKSAKMLAVVRKNQALAQSFGIEFKAAGIGPKIGSRLGGGLRSAPAGMSFVDVTGVTDADTDGIVFEGKPGLERPIIPRFMVPKDLARKLSGIVDGDAEEIEKQRRAGNTSVQFDEGKLRNIVASVGGDASLLQAVTNDRGVPATTTSGRERVSAAARNVAGNIASRRREIASRRGMRSGQRADLGDATPLSPGELNKLSEQEIVDRLIEDRYAGLNLDEAAKKYGLKGGRVEARRLEAREMQRRNNQGMRSRTTPPGIVREDYFNFEEYDFNDQVVDAMGNWMGRPDQQEMRERSGGLEALWEDFKKSDEYRDMEADMLDDNLKFSGATSDNPVLVSTAGNDRGQAEIKYDGEMFTVDVSLWNNEQDELFDTPEAKQEFDNLSEAEEYASSLFSDGMRSRNLKMSGAPKEIQDSYSEDDIKKIENSLRTGGRQELRLSWDSENNGWMLDSFDADGEVFIEADAPLVRLTDAISDVIADRYDSEAYGGEPPYLSNMNELLPDEEDGDDSWIKEYPVSGMRSVTGISEMNTSGAPKEYADALEKWRGYFGETPTRRNRRTGKVTESERNHPALPSVYWNKENESWVLSFDGEPTELSIYSDDPREAAKAVSDILETTADRYRWENEDNFGDISDLADIGEMHSDGDGKDRTVKITAGMRSSSGNINSFDDYLNHPAFDRDFAEWRKDNPGKNKRDFIDDPDGAEEYFSLGMEEAGASLNPESYFGTSGMRSRSGGMRSSTQLRGRDFKRDANIRANHLGKDAETWPRTARLQDVIYPERPYYGAQDVSRSDKIILSAPSENGGPEGKVYIAEFDDETGTLTVSWGRADSRNLQTKVYSGKTEEDFHKLLRDKEKRGYRLEGGHIPAKSSSYDKDVDWKADHEKQAKMGMRSSTGTEQRPYTNVPVTGSSALRQASYNAEKQELVVTYANGKTYTYKNFSNDDLDNSLSGPDYVLTGTAVNQIKKNHDFREGGTHTFDPQYQDVQGPGGEFSVEKLSRLGRGEKTQIPVTGSSAIEALTWDDENEDLIVTYAGGRTYTYKDVDSYWIEDLERETGTGRIINNIKKEGYRVVDGGEHGDMPSEGLTAERAEFGMRSRMAPSSGRIRAAEMEISARPQGMASRRSEGLKDPRFAVPGRDRVDPSDGQLWNRLSDEEKTTVANRAVNRERMLLNEFKQRFPRWWDRASKEADKKGWDKDLMKGGNAGWLDELHRFVTNLADDPNYPEKSRADAEKQFNDLQALYNMRINRGSHDLLEHLNPTSRRYLFDDARRDDSKKTGISASSKEMKTPSTAPRPFGDPIDVGTPIREQVGQNQKKPMKERLDAYYKRMSDKILYSDPARQARREMRKARRQGINAGGFTEREANPVDDAKRKIRRRKRLKQMRKNRTRDVSTISDSSTSNRIDGRLAHTDGQGSLVFGDKLASTLSTMMQNYRTEAKLKQTKGGVNKNRALAVLWDGAGYNGTPNIVTPDEFKALHAAGWVPVVRGHGNGSNGVRYANDWIDDPVRFITGQGGEAQGEGEYWARATQGGGGWFSWMDGSLPAGTVGLLPPSTRRVNKAELRKIQAEHAPLAKAIKAFDAGLPTGEREKMNAEEYVDQLRDHLRGSLGPIYESTMSTKMGQMTSKILESLSGSSDSKKQELLDSLEFLELISKKRTSNSYAPLLGYDTIMADSGVELIHNRTAITIVGDTFKRDDAVNLAKSKA